MADYPKEGKVKKITKPPLTPDSPHWNPDDLLGRFKTKSPRPDEEEK